MATRLMLPSDGYPAQMAGLTSASLSHFPPLPTKTHSLPNSQFPTAPILNSFADVVKGHSMKGKGKDITDVEPIPLKKPNLVGGIPSINWTASKIQRMNILENLQFSVVDKFSYGALDINELRSLIPNQCEIFGGMSD
ncbi:hypothetical protein RDI58_026750 [Solanum bulbocastanum]|uniref:Uncharacterized protein n=1 Tax=Solanum bulbocastanum TaxID=147425 RepID=A0AAN8Y1F1_SOLBU